MCVRERVCVCERERVKENAQERDSQKEREQSRRSNLFEFVTCKWLNIERKKGLPHCMKGSSSIVVPNVFIEFARCEHWSKSYIVDYR